MSQTDLAITHSAEEGTLIDGTSKGDGSAEALKAHRWRWSRNLGSWYVPRSRDKRANQALINSTVAALQEIGFSVAVEISDDPRTTAEVERDRVAHEAERAEHLATRAERARAQADSAEEAANERSARMPLGQPILTDHYSAPRMRRAYAQIRKAHENAFAAHQHASSLETRATTAGHATSSRYNPVTVANRIERLGAEIRDRERKITGYSNNLGDTFSPATGDYLEFIEQDLATLRDQFAYWQTVRADQIKSGQATDYDRSTIKPGDRVRTGRSHWWAVKRANPKTVTVVCEYGTGKIAYHEITAHKPKTAD